MDRRSHSWGGRVRTDRDRFHGSARLAAKILCEGRALVSSVEASNTPPAPGFCEAIGCACLTIRRSLEGTDNHWALLAPKRLMPPTGDMTCHILNSAISSRRFH